MLDETKGRMSTVNVLEREKDAKADKPEGVRERNKREKLVRIRQAARELFIDKGYDQTTTREIAHNAHVGVGTVFSYAADKRELLFLVILPEADVIEAKALKRFPESTPFLDQFVSALRPYYEQFALCPEIYRYVIREVPFARTGTHARTWREHRNRVFHRLEEIVSDMSRRKVISSTETVETITELLFGIFTREVRLWIAEDSPNVEEGIEALVRLLRLTVNGLNPSKGAL